MSDLKIIFSLMALLVFFLVFFGNITEQFLSRGPGLQFAAVPSAEDLADMESPEECRNGLYGCVYRTIPFGFMP